MKATSASWPAELQQVVGNFVTCEYATLTRRGEPITFPLTPYTSEDGTTIDVSTGLAYPAKAERARHNPKVGILFSDPRGSGLQDAPVVLVLALATVRDTDLQAATDRYVRVNMAKFPEAYKGQPSFILKRQQWYYTRIWMLNTPLKVLIWPGGNTDVPPSTIWQAPEGTTAPPSDPAPTAPKPPPWNAPAADWHQGAVYVLKTHGSPVLTVVDQDTGFPIPFRTKGASLGPDGFNLWLPAGMPVEVGGPACLTFHSHPEVFVGQENTAFVGEVSATGTGTAEFVVKKQLGDFSLGKTKLSTTLSMIRSSMKLNPHLKAELARRGKPMPAVNLPRKA